MPRRGVQRRAAHQRTFSERVADGCTHFFGTSTFLFVHVIVFTLWIVANTGVFFDQASFDPYPFNFLTTAVSLEAIFLSILVLMSQNRAARSANIRDEVDLQINIQSEREITKMLQMLTRIEKKLHMSQEKDAELRTMLHEVDIKKLEQRISKDL